ncbi:hypothetical protein M5689_004476 [Euphorbia peplus]|nr:hypothetical protein M5689_004476 [Euphorbia peplus]
MTDLTEETNQEMEVSEVDETLEENKISRSDFLYELNLIVTVLSLCSFSSEDCTDGSDEDHHVKSVVKDDDAKLDVSALTRKRERDLHDQKPFVRRAQRFQPMIKDSRHGRKM